MVTYHAIWKNSMFHQRTNVIRKIILFHKNKTTFRFMRVSHIHCRSVYKPLRVELIKFYVEVHYAHEQAHLLKVDHGINLDDIGFFLVYPSV